MGPKQPRPPPPWHAAGLWTEVGARDTRAEGSANCGPCGTAAIVQQIALRVIQAVSVQFRLGGWLSWAPPECRAGHRTLSGAPALQFPTLDGAVRTLQTSLSWA